MQLQLMPRPVFLKLDFLAPKGFFKDRGSELMMNVLRGEGVARIADDVSGNAGVSIAAYAAYASIQTDVLVRTYTSPAKQVQIAAYGAQVD